MSEEVRTCLTCPSHESNDPEANGVDPGCDMCAAALSAKVLGDDFPQVPENAYSAVVEFDAKLGGGGALESQPAMKCFVYAADPSMAASFASECVIGEYYWMKRGGRPTSVSVTRKSDGETSRFVAEYDDRMISWVAVP